MKTIVLVVVLAGSWYGSVAQAQSRVDSLEAQLAGASGPARLALLADLVEDTYRNDPGRAVAYGREALALLATYPDAELAQRVLFLKGQGHHYLGEPDSVLAHAGRLEVVAAESEKARADASFLRGLVQQDQDGYAEALVSLEAARSGYEAVGDPAGEALALENIGLVHRLKGDYDAALSVFERTRARYEDLGDRQGLASVLYQIGVIHRARRNYDQALSYYTRALALREELGDRRGLALSFNSLGVLHRAQRDYDQALSYYTRALALYEDLGDKQGIALLLNNLGNLYRNQGAYEQALSFLMRALHAREELGDTGGMASTLSNIGIIHRRHGDYDQALSVYTRSLALREELGNTVDIAATLNRIGLIHDERGEYAQALSFFTRSLTLYEDLGDTRGIAASFSNIGNIYENQGDYDAALDFLSRALALREDLGDKPGIASTLNNIANVYVAQGDLSEALTVYKRSLVLKEELGDPAASAVVLYNIGTLHLQRGDYAEARSFLTRSLALYEAIGEPEGQAYGFSSLGALYLAQDSLDEALQATDRAVALADSIGALPYLRTAHQQRADILERQGRFAEALAAYRAYHAVDDSLFNSESQGVIAELQAQYRTKEQQQQIELLETRRSRQRLWVMVLLGGVGLLMVIIGLQVARMRLRRRALAAIEKARRETEEKAEELQEKAEELQEKAEELRKANDLKSRFLANISHEFRTPLTLTFGPLDDLLQGRFHVEEAARPHLERARRNGGRLLRLINQLLDLSKLDAGALLLRPRRHDLAGHLRQMAALFDSIAETRGIHYATEIPEASLWHVYDADKIEKVVINLLSNAFKFTPQGRKVALALRKDDAGAVCITVADTGQGIAKAHLDHLFDRFYQVEGATTRSHEGSGIGLALVKELVELHGGTISVESQEGFFTRFTVDLPISDFGLRNADLEEGAAAVEQGPDAVSGDGATPVQDLSGSLRVRPMPVPEAVSVADEDTVVLVVEDNADMRAYIRTHLEDHFTVVEAENGKQGVAHALDLVPDLVLSDVMMPEMDGLEVCRVLKQDERTSHIPVVFLTARAQVEHRIEGFESGADAYLPKPFNAEELLVRVRTLIEERRRLRIRFAGMGPEPDEASPAEALSLPPREAAFLEQVEALIAEHLGDELFGVDALAEAVAMSSRQLLRKLRALTDETPANMIRRMRLAQAGALLREGALSVKEVCYAVGFQSTSSFTRAFGQVYGVPPSAYAEQTRDEARQG